MKLNSEDAVLRADLRVDAVRVFLERHAALVVDELAHFAKMSAAETCRDAAANADSVDLAGFALERERSAVAAMLQQLATVQVHETSLSALKALLMQADDEFESNGIADAATLLAIEDELKAPQA